MSFPPKPVVNTCFLEGVVHMKIYLIIFAWLAAAVAVPQSADKPIDLTGADASKFRSQVGHTVILRGRLGDGKEGLLLGGMPNHVLLYVLHEMPPTESILIPRHGRGFCTSRCGSPEL